MGMMSGGVLTVSNVGVSAVTYIPYSGYSEMSVVTTRIAHTTPDEKDSDLVLDIAAQQAELNDRDRRHHQEQDECLRRRHPVTELHKPVLIDLRDDYLCAVAHAARHQHVDQVEHFERGNRVE